LNYLELSQSKWQEVKAKLSAYIKSGMLPKAVNTPEKAMLIAAKGAELGLSPVYSLTHINVIQGKPTISSELMLSLALKRCPDMEIIYEQHNTEGCKIKARRSKDSKLSEFSFTIEDAKRAGLSSKDNWRNYPQDMCRNRAISQMCRALFPDAIAGCSYTPEELEGSSDKAQIREIEQDFEAVEVKQSVIEEKLQESLDAANIVE